MVMLAALTVAALLLAFGAVCAGVALLARLTWRAFVDPPD